MTDQYSVSIDNDWHLIMTTWGKTVDDNGLDSHFQNVCSDPNLLSYNECIDFSDVERINVGTSKLSSVASEVMSRLKNSPKLAIVAPSPLAFGLARMYEAFHSIPGYSKQVYVFQEKSDAVKWLKAPLGAE